MISPRLSIQEKLAAIEKSKMCGLKATANECRVSLRTLQRWRNAAPKMQMADSKRQKKITLHLGPNHQKVQQTQYLLSVVKQVSDTYQSIFFTNKQTILDLCCLS
jgi:phenylalanyl-tRNA synthetase alpha subunit